MTETTQETKAKRKPAGIKHRFTIKREDGDEYGEVTMTVVASRGDLAAAAIEALADKAEKLCEVLE